VRPTTERARYTNTDVTQQIQHNCANKEEKTTTDINQTLSQQLYNIHRSVTVKAYKIINYKIL
jgi:hypothetical protein